ncbi:hypothetical protein Pla110_35240 [Polystyrenella longa]|uniref:GH10 domain-containing protein n=1 Tax=Polystyrenella longa TaxID=2528007 RepID=A0A518CRE3_9PLAN|nr:endo-1,4-beta-xylanase [Polystyrenella longa]QDU81774.1 hypothetical protein Pla110_35240 [Polystyrenella longa]
MGVIRFAFDPEQNSNELMNRLGDRAFLVSYEGKVFPGQQLLVQDNQIAIRKADERSAKLSFPWPLEQLGDVLFQTGSLMEREEPYSLLVELARGKVSALRNQSGNWQIMGMTIPAEFYERLDRAHEFLSQGVQTQTNIKESSRLGGAALEQAQAASDILMSSFIGQRMKLQSRRYTVPPLHYSCGVSFDFQKEENEENLKSLLARFDEFVLPLHWNMDEELRSSPRVEEIDETIDFLISQNKIVSAGPLLDFSSEGLPAWLKQWQGDAISMQSLLCDFIETIVSRFAGKIRKWDLSVNSEMGAADEEWSFLSEEVRLRFLSRSLEIMQQIDNQLEISLLVTDPWGVYHGDGGYLLTSLTFVDVLTRARGKLSSLKLVLTDGYENNRVPSFDWLELSRIVDYWSSLGIPLQVVLAAPSSGETQENSRIQVDSKQTHLVSLQSQADWYEKVISLMIAKESVTGIQFEHFHDGSPNRYAASGFVDTTGKPKISFDQLARLQTFAPKP